MNSRKLTRKAKDEIHIEGKRRHRGPPKSWYECWTSTSEGAYKI